MCGTVGDAPKIPSIPGGSGPTNPDLQVGNPIVDPSKQNPANPVLPGVEIGISLPGESNQPTPPQPSPPPSFSPEPTPTDPNPQETAAQRLKRLAALRMGFAKTIKTSPQGVSASPLVSVPQAYFPGTKGKLGQ